MAEWTTRKSLPHTDMITCEIGYALRPALSGTWQAWLSDGLDDGDEILVGSDYRTAFDAKNAVIKAKRNELEREADIVDCVVVGKEQYDEMNEIILGAFEQECRRADGKYNHQCIWCWQNAQYHLISVGLIKEEDCVQP